ncbi:hypothetical protein [Agrobacterium tumefaciens]|uniref:hypothetical protein n=1 Tax=Agrobacterium tumefaciens TaxID=358 RepID=UPI0022444B0D|nr:hypothetical protein [Agrobacterium tumefaciens]MCW8059133.1 hypothetical protein [Agrobacterium tumefaciens]MCW8143375.1 hypothetical protein [Agrobacterium tumefaciens]
MADSDNSTTLPYVTRRKLLTGSAIAVGTWNSGACAGHKIAGTASADPALKLWYQWQDAYGLTEHLRCRQQGLERQLAETVGFPFAMIHLSDGEPVAAYSREAIHDVFRFTPEEAAACAKAEAEFAAHQLRWDRADREIGYSATVQAEREAGDRAEDLLYAMAATSATTLAGVAAKLDAVLREGNVFEDGSEFPWPHIRSALADIRRLEEYAAKGATT